MHNSVIARKLLQYRARVATLSELTGTEVDADEPPVCHLEDDVTRRDLGTASALLAVVLGASLSGGTAAAAADGDTAGLTVGEASVATEVSPTKVDVMGLWAHPDDDAGFTTPCGVWQDRFDVTCGIIMTTRGEGGSNSVGPESGPALGLRRENEDRASHVRSGTVDIYNVDRVDFFYNTSAPLTAEVWDKEEGLRQTVRIVRETQPEIVLASNPVARGHGNHQYAQGRLVWEVVAAAADPTMFPEQLEGPDAVEPWQVKKIVGGGPTTGTGGSTDAPDCTTGFVPDPANPYTVAGFWTGYDSPYVWAEGNVQAQPAGTPKTWAQVGREGGRAHPTQARVMEKGLFAEGCTRYSITKSLVPIQPNSSPDAGRDDAVLFGAYVADPGGMPLGSTFAVEAEEFFVAPDTSFEVTVDARSGEGDVAPGTVALTAPAGWTVSDPQTTGPISDSDTASLTFTVTPGADAALGLQRLAVTFDNGTVTAYNDTQVQLVQAVEGRFQRGGNQVEYDQWAEQYTWLGGRSAAILDIGAGESVTVPVEVTNRSTEAATGTVSLALPAGFAADATSVDFADLAAGEQTTVEFVLTHTVPDALAGSVEVPVTTTFGDGDTSTEVLALTVVPTTVIPRLDTAPVLDGLGTEGYGAQQIDLGGRWEGDECAPDGVDCGAGSTARLGWNGDDLYVQARVVDDVSSAAATPDRCFGHWLVDSLEILLDPSGDSVDTSTTFKTGVFPFTDDAENVNGNGVDGPCWSRDADNHQGFSTGPLAELVEGGLNSPGQEVAVQAVVEADGSYAGGGWDVEVKIPLANLPAAVGPTSAAPTGAQATNAVDPEYLGLNVTPYDSDTQDFIGKTRTAWSAVGGQQSEPYRWGHAYLDGYTPPVDRSTVSDEPIIPDTALLSVDSPQSVWQSATRGVTLSGQQPSRSLTVSDVSITDSEVTVALDSTEAGTARVFLTDGDLTHTPVWTSSCAEDVYGFDACSAEDGAAPPWGSDLGGLLVGSALQDVSTGTSTVTVPVDQAGLDKLAEEGTVLVSYESASGGVNAWSFPVVEKVVDPTGPVFSDVSPGDAYYDQIRWLADSGYADGQQLGDKLFYFPNAPLSRQALAGVLYRYAGTDWTPDADTQTFSDVRPGSPFHTQVEWMVEEKLTDGIGGGRFGATRPATRQDLAIFLYRLAGRPDVAGESTFTDVKPRSRYGHIFTWAQQAQVATADSDGSFGAARPITRAETAGYLYGYDRFSFATLSLPVG